MKYTTFFYCENKKGCGFESALSEGGGHVIAQCDRCLALCSFASEETERAFASCLACGEQNELPEGEFKEGIVCAKCGSRGKVGFESGGGALFELEIRSVAAFKCRCKNTSCRVQSEEPFACPLCRKKLKQKMSAYWEDEI